jgi:hypothetical protein
MALTSRPPSAELVVEFAELERDGALGTQMSWDAEFCKMPAKGSIPDLQRERSTNPRFGIELASDQFVYHHNTNYYRRLADYEFAWRLYRPVRVVVRNAGRVAANNVRVELTVPMAGGTSVIQPGQMPDPPKRRYPLLHPGAAAMSGIQPRFNSPGDVDIDDNADRLRIAIDCRDLQPGRRVWSRIFYIARTTTGEIALTGQVFAGNLPGPRNFTLTIAANVTRTRMTVAELMARPEPAQPDE